MSFPTGAPLASTPATAAPARARVWHRERLVRDQTSRGESAWRQCTCNILPHRVVLPSSAQAAGPTQPCVRTVQVDAVQEFASGGRGSYNASRPSQEAPSRAPTQQHLQKQLTRSITSTKGPEQLHALLQRTPAHVLNHFHVTAAATHLAHMLEQPQNSNPGAARMQPPIPCVLVDGGTAPTAGTGWPGAAAAGTAPQLVLAQLLPWVDSNLHSFDTRGVANLLWALARLAHSQGLQLPPVSVQPPNQPAATEQPSPPFSPPHPSTTLPATSTAAPHVNGHAKAASQNGSSWPLDHMVAGSTVRMPGPMAFGAQALQSTATTLANHACNMGWQQFNSQQLSNFLWAAATLQLPLPEQHVQAAMATVAARPADLTSQGLANILWAAAHFHTPPPNHLLDLAPGLLSTADATPQAISCTLWAVATLELQPPVQWTQQILHGATGQLRHFGPQALSNTAWAIAHFGFTPAACWLHTFLDACLRRAPDMQPRELSMLLWALERMSHASVPATWGSQPQRCTHQGRHGHVYQLPSLSDAGAQPGAAGADLKGGSVRLRPSDGWVAKAAGHVGVALPRMAAGDVVTASKALADMGWVPDEPWLAAWCVAVGRQLGPGASGCASGPTSSRAASVAIAVAAGWCQTVSSPAAATNLGRLLDSACDLLAQHYESQQQQGHAASSNGVSRSGSEESDPGLQLLTALSALCWQPAQAWVGLGLDAGLQRLLAVVQAWAVEPPHTLEPQQQVVLCWALAKLGSMPDSTSQRKQVLQRLAMVGAQGIQLVLSGKEAAMLVWVGEQWLGTKAAATLAQLLSRPATSSVCVLLPAMPSTAPIARASQQYLPQVDKQQEQQQTGQQPQQTEEQPQQEAGQQWQQQQQGDGEALPRAGEKQHLVTALVAVARQWRWRSDPYQRRALQPTALSLLAQTAQAADRLGMQDVSRCLWSAVQLGYSPGAAWSGRMAASVMRALASDPHGACPHLPQAMWAMSRLGIRPPPRAAAALFRTCLLGSTHRLCEPAQLCGVLAAASAWGVRPSAAWWDRLWAQPAWSHCLDYHPSQDDSRQMPGASRAAPASIASSHATQGWSDVELLSMLNLLTELQASPPADWLIALFNRLRAGRQGSSSGSRVLPAGVLSVRVKLLAAALQLLPVEPLAAPAEQEQRHGGRDEQGPVQLQRLEQEQQQQLAAMAPAESVVGLQTAEQYIPQLDLRGCIRLLAACSHMSGSRCLAPALDSLVTTALWTCQHQLQQASPAALLRLLRVLGWLNARPDPDWASDMLQALRMHMVHMTDAQLAACLPLLAATRCRPDRAWLVDYLMLISPRMQLAQPGAPQPASSKAGVSQPASSQPGSSQPAKPSSAAVTPQPSSTAPAIALPAATVPSVAHPAPVSPANAQAASWLGDLPPPAVAQRPLWISSRGIVSPGSAVGAAASAASRSPQASVDAQHPLRQQQQQRGPAGDAQQSDRTVSSPLASPQALSQLSSALLRLDPELGRQWRAQLLLRYE